MKNIGIATATGGIMRVDSTQPTNEARPRNRIRDSAYAASVAMTSASAVEPQAITTESSTRGPMLKLPPPGVTVPSPGGPKVTPNTFWKLSSVGVKSNTSGGRAKMSRPSRKATLVQK